MPLAISPVPEISISLASPEEPAHEPFSPFSPGFCKDQPSLSESDDNWRATLLSPPPIHSPKNLSPLRPLDIPVKGQGLERERFEALLKASRERNMALGSRKAVDLRKEIAIKTHQSKQVERRALFLSKLQAPPSPTATLTPKTPPESPAIFHYSLPSPGLDSPIAVFESLADGKASAPVRQPWVEQVDFRLPGRAARPPALRTAPVVSKRKPLPSLDQITARLTSHVAGAGPEAREPPASAVAPRTPSARLPAFLQSGKRLVSQQQQGAEPRVHVVNPPEPKARPQPPTPVGRLQFPVRSSSLPEPLKLAIRSPKPCLPPASPPLSPPPRLQVTTTVVPRTSATSPVELTERNLLAFNAASREDTARKMLTRLARRTISPTTPVTDIDIDLASRAATTEGETERKLRRRSAPPELQGRERSGFTHDILKLPGAF